MSEGNGNKTGEFEASGEWLERFFRIVSAMGSGEPSIPKVAFSFKDGHVSGQYSNEDRNIGVLFDATTDGKATLEGSMATHEAAKVVTLLSLFSPNEKIKVSVDDYIHFTGERRSGRVGLYDPVLVNKVKATDWLVEFPTGHQGIVNPKCQAGNGESWKYWIAAGNTVAVIPYKEIMAILEVGAKSGSMEKKSPLLHITIADGEVGVVVGDEKDKSSSLIYHPVSATSVEGATDILLHYDTVAPSWGALKYARDESDCVLFVPETKDSVALLAMPVKGEKKDGVSELFRITYMTSTWGKRR